MATEGLANQVFGFVEVGRPAPRSSHGRNVIDHLGFSGDPHDKRLPPIFAVWALINDSLAELLGASADPVAAGYHLQQLATAGPDTALPLALALASQREQLSASDPAIVGALLRVLHTLMLRETVPRRWEDWIPPSSSRSKRRCQSKRPIDSCYCICWR